jgi:hypothetical protein
MLFECLEKVKDCSQMRCKFARFQPLFDSKAKVIGLVSLQGVKQWREGMTVLQRCIELVPSVGDE